VEAFACPRCQFALVEQVRNLAVGMIVQQTIDGGDDLRRRLPCHPCGLRQRHGERARRASLETDLHRDDIALEQGDVVDEQARHPLALAIWSAWVVP